MKPNLRLVLYAIFNLLNVVVFVTLFMSEQWKLFFYLTLLSFWSNCFYFLATFILDLRAYFFKRVSTSFLPYLRDHYFKYSCCFSGLVVLGFYFLLVLGDNFIVLPSSSKSWLLSIYLHGGVFLYVLFDLLFIRRSYISNFKKDVIIISILMGIYTILAYISLYILKNAPYKFMDAATFPQILMAFLNAYIVLINFYFAYQWFLRKKMKIEIVDNSVLIDPDAEGLSNSSNIDINSTINTTIFASQFAS